MSSDKVAQMRLSYTRGGLSEDSAPSEPLSLFGEWFEAATEAEVLEPNAMTLATVSPDGWPSARVVLLKAYDAEGFIFYTNYESRKGRELDAVGRAALVFWWGPLERQVRVEGAVSRVSPELSDAYFQSRPRGSRLGAWASPQSQPIDARGELDVRLAQATARYEEGEVPRPPHWGGYRLTPRRVEFWQGRPSRLHDRLLYSLEDGGQWRRQRLAP